jgi:hypothetical protein
MEKVAKATFKWAETKEKMRVKTKSASPIYLEQLK